MKVIAIRAVFLAVLIFILHACASPDTEVTGLNKPQPAGAVPGETLPDDQRIEPGGFGNPGPNVRW
jgi:hypothetical protein